MHNSLITADQRFMLPANRRESLATPDFDPAPVAKLFTPDSGATRLLCAFVPVDYDYHLRFSHW